MKINRIAAIVISVGVLGVLGFVGYQQLLAPTAAAATPVSITQSADG